MAISYVAKGAFASGTGAINVGAVSGVQAGDLLLLVCESANQAFTTPSGWTEISGSPVSRGTAAAAGGVRLAVFYKIADGADSATTVADTGDHTTGIKVAYRGVDQTTPFDATPTSANGSSTTITWATVTTATDGCMVVLAAANDRDSASTANVSSYSNSGGTLGTITERHDQTVSSGVGGGVVVADAQQTTAAATGSTTATNAANVGYCTLTIPLRPAAPPSVPTLAAHTLQAGVTTTSGIDTTGGSGSCLLLLVCDGTLAGTPDNKGNSYTLIDESAAMSAGGTQFQRLYRCDNFTGGTGHTWSVVNGSGVVSAPTVGVQEWLGCDATAPYRATSSWTLGSGGSNPRTAGPVSCSADDGAAVFSVSDSVSGTITWTRGDSFTQTDTAGSGATFWAANTAAQAGLAAGTVSSSQTHSPSGDDSIDIVVVLRAPGGVITVDAAQGGGWSVRNASAGTQASAWSVRNEAATTKAGAWSVRNAAATTQAGAWSVRNAAAAAQASAWSVRNAVAATQAGAWSVLGTATVVATQAGAWSVRNAVATTQASAWSVRNAVATTQASAWSVRNAVATTQAGAWSVRNAAAATLAAAWSVRNAIAASQGGAWSVRIAAGTTQAGAWSVRNVASTTQAGAWSVRNAVAATQAGAWSVLAAGTATATQDGAWSVRNTAAASLAGAWSVRAAVSSTQASAWSVRNAASSNKAGGWSVRVAVTATQGCAWSVLGSSIAAAVQSGAWSVRNAVGATLPGGWSIGALERFAPRRGGAPSGATQAMARPDDISTAARGTGAGAERPAATTAARRPAATNTRSRA